MFQSTNIELANVEYCTNIIDLHQQKECNGYEHIIEMSSLINFDDIHINQ
jgi:hypothetical protein